MRTPVLRNLVFGAALTSCTDRELTTPSDSPDTSGTDGVSEGTDGTQTSSGPAGTAGEDSGTSRCEDATLLPYECDRFQQNCPDGEYCAAPYPITPYWVLAACRPDPPVAKTEGETCSRWADPAPPQLSLDDCAPGLSCFPPGASSGTCLPACSGGAGNPECEAGLACAYDAKPRSGECGYSVCLRPCDPRAPDCDEGEVCDAHEGGFYCVQHIDNVNSHGSCVIGGCADGLFCNPVLPDYAEWCDSNLVIKPCDAACQSFCDLDSGEGCPPSMGLEQECVPWYGAGCPDVPREFKNYCDPWYGSPPPEFATLGRCRRLY
jgi:hypothetical protein